MKKLALLCFFLITLNATAGETWLTTSLYAYHFDREWTWNENQQLVGLEHQKGPWFGGVSAFKNSFGDDSQALYGGYQWGDDYGVRLAGGLARGYKDEYCEKEIQTSDNELKQKCESVRLKIGDYKAIAIISTFKKVGRARLELVALGFDAIMIAGSVKL